MKASVLIPAVVFALAGHVLAQVSETTVRLTYAKLIFANQVAVIEKNLPFGSTKPNPAVPNILQQNQLAFELSNFRVGEIVGNPAPMLSLSSSFSGKPVLVIALTANTFSTEGKQDSQETTATMQWATGQAVDYKGQHFMVWRPRDTGEL